MPSQGNVSDGMEVDHGSYEEEVLGPASQQDRGLQAGGYEGADSQLRLRLLRPPLLLDCGSAFPRLTDYTFWYHADEVFFDAEEEFREMRSGAAESQLQQEQDQVQQDQLLAQIGVSSPQQLQAILLALQQTEEEQLNEEDLLDSEDEEEWAWNWGNGGVPGSRPEDYSHPSQIPKFMSKAEWFKAHAARPLYTAPDCPVTVMKAVVFLMGWKFDFGVTDAAFNVLLAMLSEQFLPKVSGLCFAGCW
jgi:hypothetical protein